jgi:hypothetical protein
LRGYLTQSGDYYESPSGPQNPGDVSVPLNPSDGLYNYDHKRRTWRSNFGLMEHNYPRASDGHESIDVSLTEKKLFSVRDTMYILGILTAAATVYFGIVAKLELTQADLAHMKSTMLDHQTYANTSLKECTAKIHELELNQAKMIK